MKNNNKVLIMAHRGASSIAPENTLKAFKTAIELKADFIEFDVLETKDGEIVVCHDHEISRLTGQHAYIRDLSLGELKSFDFGEGEKIPTLEELIEVTIGKINLNCEVIEAGISYKVVKILQKYSIIESTIISSFILSELLQFQKIDSELKLGLVLTKDMVSPRWVIKFCKKAINNNFFAIHPYWKAINKEIVEFAHSNGLIVNIWTQIYEPIEDSDLREVVRMGIDGLMHDDIQQAKRVIYES